MSSPSLVRGLGLTAAISIVIADVIGTGVFLKARVMTCNVETPWLVLTVWVVAGLLSLAGALTYAELAAMMPRAGGEYVFVREAYGRVWAFLFGWMRFFIGNTGGMAALAAGLAIFLNVLTAGALAASSCIPIGSSGGIAERHPTGRCRRHRRSSRRSIARRLPSAARSRRCWRP